MYLDTAILVKLLVPEPDTEYYGKLVEGQAVSSSWLGYTEVWSALLGKERGGGITAEQRRRAWAVFERYLEAEFLWLAPASEAVYKRANRIIEQCHPGVPLRSLDALHLATCDQLQDWPLCTNDRRMRDAAGLMGFPLTNLPAGQGGS